MGFSSDWDVNEYRDEHQPQEHWRLTVRFINAHKSDIPEQRLVCLARCFANMEFLGCRYPEETMEQVTMLAGDIADDYRRRKRNKAQRTFVGASSAAEAKVKRLKTTRGRS